MSFPISSIETMLYSLVFKNVIASHDVAEEALIYSYGRSFNGFAATISAATSKSVKFPNSSWLCVVQFGDMDGVKAGILINCVVIFRSVQLSRYGWCCFRF
jgi:hypothetical protein